jgi:hypothetical protein
MTPLETLRALGTGSEAPVQAKQRVYSALLLSLEAAAGAAAAGVAAVPRPPATLPPTPLPVLGGIAGGKTLALAAGIWLLGGATGAALYGALRPQQVRVVYVDQPTPVSLVTSPAKQPEIPAPPLAIARLNGASKSGAGRASAAPSTVTFAAGPTSDLARERALLDLARANAARGEPALALEQTEQHRQQFPHGRLSEEREALAIRALISLGRMDQAQDRAQTFRAAYPNSFLTPVIDSALSAP